VGVGEGPEILDQETPIASRRGNGNGGRRGKQSTTPKRESKSAKQRSNNGNAAAPDSDVPVERPGPAKERGSSRDRSLHRLLAGLRAVNAVLARAGAARMPTYRARVAGRSGWRGMRTRASVKA